MRERGKEKSDGKAVKRIEERKRKGQKGEKG